jgi:hypothetical protein
LQRGRNVEGHSLKKYEEKEDPHRSSMDESVFSFSSRERTGISLVIEYQEGIPIC